MTEEIFTPIQTVWLLDGAALTDEEMNMLCRQAQHHFVYDHLDHTDHRRMGPLLIAECADVLEIIATLKGDPVRAWSVSKWTSPMPWEELVQHARELRYIRTADGQRFYLRFADSRSFASVWDVLTERQQSRIMAPLSSWEYSDRKGKAVKLAHTAAMPFESIPVSLSLNQKQLNLLLDLIWPDQLLAGWLEDNPTLQGRVDRLRAYQLSQQACLWFNEVDEERFDIQKDLLGRLIDSDCDPLDTRSIRRLLATACEDGLTV